MSPVAEVIINNINCTNDWPENVSKLYLLFTRPCPKHLIFGEVRDALSGDAREMYDELSFKLSPLLSIEDRNAADRNDRNIADILDILLSSIPLANSTIFLPSAEVELRL